MNEPLPAGASILDPVIRHGAFLAVAVLSPGWFTARWHVWHASGRYIGFATDAGLIPLVIARHQSGPGQ